MKKSLGVVVALTSALGASAANAEFDFYGKANVSLESVKEDVLAEQASSTTELVSNASRIGVKGAEKIADGVEAIYQLEYEITVDDAQTFKQRDIFVGIKGGYGQVIGGHFDTPLKTAQNKIDLFNDLRGDIKNIVTANDLRMSNTVEYTTPDIFAGFKAEVALINSEDDAINNGTSVALSWANDHFYVALANDQDVLGEGVDATRLVLQYNRGQWQLGALIEENKTATVDPTPLGYAVSVQYKLPKAWVLKAQYGSLDWDAATSEVPDLASGKDTSTSIGADYVITETAKAFGFYTEESIQDDLLNNRYLGLGFELKF